MTIKPGESHADTDDISTGDELDLDEYGPITSEEDDEGVPLDDWIETEKKKNNHSEDDDDDQGDDDQDDDDDEDDEDDADDDEDDEDQDDDDDEDDDEDDDDDFVGDSYDKSDEGQKHFKKAAEAKFKEIEALAVKSKDQSDSDYASSREKAASMLENLLSKKPKLAEAVAKEFLIAGKKPESAAHLLRKLKGEKEPANNSSQSADPAQVARTMNIEIENMARNRIDDIEGMSYKKFKTTKAFKNFKSKARDYISKGLKPEDFFDDAWKLSTMDDALEQSYKKGKKTKKKQITAKNSTPTKKRKAGSKASGKKYGDGNLMSREDHFELTQNNPAEAKRYYRETKGKFTN